MKLNEHMGHAMVESIVMQARLRLNSATPGPWAPRSDGADRIAIRQLQPEARKPRHGTEFACYLPRNSRNALNDADFIAHAREDVELLLEIIDRLMSELRQDGNQ